MRFTISKCVARWQRALSLSSFEYTSFIIFFCTKHDIFVKKIIVMKIAMGIIVFAKLAPLPTAATMQLFNFNSIISTKEHNKNHQKMFFNVKILKEGMV